MQMVAFIFYETRKAKPSFAARTITLVLPMPINSMWIYGFTVKILLVTLEHIFIVAKGVWRNGLAHTAVHNTVTVDHRDQMKMVSRFTWTNWSHGKVLKHEENLWQGEQDGYKPVTHQRTVMALHRDRWLVVDHLQDTRAPSLLAALVA